MNSVVHHADSPVGPAGPAARAGRALAASPLALTAIAWLVLTVLTSVFADQLAPFDPLTQNLTELLKPPSATHWLGTDSLGRDVLSRLMHGGDTLLWGAAEATAIAVALGLPAGLLSGYRGGIADAVISWLVDLTFAVPAFVVLVALAVIYPQNTVVMMAVLGVLGAGAATRLVRNSTRTVRDELFVDAARVSGLPLRTILFRHVLPTVVAPVIMLAATSMAICVIVLSSLSFLGLGGSPEAPSWGQMIYEASQNITVDSWLLVPPGAVLILTVIAFNLIANTVRDALPGGPTPRPVRHRRTVLAPPAVQRRDTDPETLLGVHGLVVAFPCGPVVDGVTFTVRKGETLGLVGESGSGKTVTALAIPGLLPIDGQITAGSVRFAGEELAGTTERRLSRVRGRGVAYIAQEPMAALDPCYTVGNQLRAALRHFGATRRTAAARARDLLREVGVDDPDRVMRCHPHQISGGMAQRVAIALALTGDPALLIADEPTTALDVTVQAAILDLFRNVVATGERALVLVSHDIGVVADVCDRVAVMYAGQIVEQGETDSVLGAPRHPYTRALLRSMPSLDTAGRLPVIPGSVPAPDAWPEGCRFAARCALATDACKKGPIPLMDVSGPSPRTTRCVRGHDLAPEPGR
ncbi:dipeptide/oligopeptide/nickel ABC transporter permease/ATP-binding protein [Streptacidiphilus sp. N1-10]|uniref:Dipeptide/oligopeptide/nickel ABC transporter permease/ATP-binding protein n=1 Tax=Streptacidiphilus jeojiensis TaxID=3229225 RepID=A0ABV6XXW2_9ACTN